MRWLSAVLDTSSNEDTAQLHGEIVEVVGFTRILTEDPAQVLADIRILFDGSLHAVPVEWLTEIETVDTEPC